MSGLGVVCNLQVKPEQRISVGLLSREGLDNILALL